MAKYIVGNWKSNKTVKEAQEWLIAVSESDVLKTENSDKKAIICAPFTALVVMQWEITHKRLALGLGAQNCSPFSEGAYTGEVTAQQVKELGEYVILGHSERREHFGETDELLTQKVALAKEAGLSIIFCVQGKETFIPEGVSLVAYEPVFAIGSGSPDTPENAEAVSHAIKEKGIATVLYGGSVKPENIASFTAQPSIDGALIGGASLEADSFITLVENA